MSDETPLFVLLPRATKSSYEQMKYKCQKCPTICTSGELDRHAVQAHRVTEFTVNLRRLSNA